SIFLPSTPPAALICLAARRTPSRMEMPMGDEPLVYGPITPTLMVLSAAGNVVAVIVNAHRAENNEGIRFIDSPWGLGALGTENSRHSGACCQGLARGKKIQFNPRPRQARIASNP